MKKAAVLDGCCPPLLAAPLAENEATELASAFKALADPVRLRLLSLIAAAPDMTGERPMVGLGGRAPAPGTRPRGCFFAARSELVHDAFEFGDRVRPCNGRSMVLSESPGS